MNNPVFALLIITAYLMSLKLLSILAYRRSQSNIEDFFLVNRSLSTILLLGTLLATVVNGLAITAVPALVYQGGILFGQMYIVCIVLPVCIYVFGPIIWQLGNDYKVITQGELFGAYYKNKSLKSLVGIIGIFSVLPFMTIQLSAVGKVLSSISNGSVPYELGVLLCSASVGLYLYFGGARAVVWTDAIQSIIFLAVIVTTAFLFSYWAGGFSTATTKLSLLIPEKLYLSSSNSKIFLDNILSWPFAFFLWPMLFQRMFMGDNKRTIRRSGVYTGILLTIVISCSMTSGISATSVLYGKISDSDQLLAEMYQRFLPIGGSFILLAAFSTGMSTIDSMLLTLSSITVRDLPRRDSKKIANPQREFLWSKIIAMFYLLSVTLLALSEVGRGAITPLVTLGASLATLFLWPLIGLHPRINLSSRAVFSSILSGLFTIVLFRFTALTTYLPFGFATAGFLSGLICFLASVKIKNNKNEEILIDLDPQEQAVSAKTANE